MTRSLVLVPSFLVTLVLNACAVPSGDCTKSSGGLFGGTVTIDLNCGDSDTGTGDSTVTDSDSVPDTNSETGDSDSVETGETGDTAKPIDADGDGFTADDDCDDADPAINPGSVEVCNGVDDDCDGNIDSDAADQKTFYADADGDGYGDASATIDGCSAPVGYVENDTDCDDTDATVHPYAVESCTDTIDLNCDGSAGTSDLDGDGTIACEDCDDTDATAYPGNTEVCDGVDNDCEGTVDEGATDALTWYADSDGDGYGDPSISTSACDEPSDYVADSTDCDDGDLGINPGAAEVCNGADDDCDGSTDEDFATIIYYPDADGDGYGAGVGTSECADPGAGYSTNVSDCDDTDAGINPAEVEACDGVDNDCSGSADDGLSWTSSYADADGDSFGDPSISTATCDGTAPSGYVFDLTDCNDADSGINPGELETCNSVDDDCDGVVDDGAVDALTWYVDADNDGYGNVAISTTSCSEPSGYTADNTDCDDTNNDSYPGDIEWCDGVDNDCSGSADDGDYDGDGYDVCADCDDGDASLNPGEPEVCNGADDDCDGSTDEGVTSVFYADSDGDSYGDSSTTDAACSAPAGYVSDSTDCDDGDDGVYPGASEVCDSVDNDCDGSVDEDLVLFCADGDGDGYGNPDACTDPLSCTQKATYTSYGYMEDSADCNDSDATVYPGHGC